MNMLIEERTLSLQKSMTGAEDPMVSTGVDELTQEEFTEDTLPYIENQVDSGQDIEVVSHEDSLTLRFRNEVSILVREMIIMPEESDREASFGAVTALTDKYKSKDE